MQTFCFYWGLEKGHGLVLPQILWLQQCSQTWPLSTAAKLEYTVSLTEPWKDDVEAYERKKTKYFELATEAAQNSWERWDAWD